MTAGSTRKLINNRRLIVPWTFGSRICFTARLGNGLLRRTLRLAARRQVRLQHRIQVAPDPRRRRALAIAGPRHQRSADQRLDGSGETTDVDVAPQLTLDDGRAEERFDLLPAAHD